MLALLKSLFSSGAKSSDRKVRRLSHPRDLRAGDIIKFSFLPQQELSNTEFEVYQINTYIYGDLCYPELVLRDRGDNLFYMMLEEEDGEEYIAISRKIPKSQIEDILGPHSFADLSAESADPPRNMGLRQTPDELRNWSVSSYVRTGNRVRGDFVKGDARYLTDAEIRQREKFVSYIYEDSSEEYALEIEVYSTGEVEACATIYHGINAITEMWPARERGPEVRAHG